MIRVRMSCVLFLAVVSQSVLAQSVRHRAVLPSPPSQSGLTLDQSRATTGTIPAGGGSLSVTTSDGTRFTLTVPAGAFLSDEDITMIPVATMTRLPFSGGLRAAVQLAPEGLRLQKPATLTIDAAQPLSLSGQRPIAFGYHGDGDALYLFPAVISGSHAEFALMHFSGYGAGSGNDGDVQAQQQRTPANAEDRAQQDIAAEIARYTALQAWWAVLVGQLQGAATDPNTFELVYFQFLAWRNMALTEPLAIPLIESGWAFVTTALDLALQNAQIQCLSDPTRVSVMLRLVEIAKQPELRTRGTALEKARSLVSKCLAFELQFDSEMSLTSPVTGFDARLKSTVPFHMELDQSDRLVIIPASAPLNYVKYTTFYQDCTAATQTTDSTLTVANDASGTLSRIDFALDVPSNYAAGQQPRDIRLTIDYGAPSDRVLSLTCGSPPQTQPVPSGPEYWRAGWAQFHGGLYGENERISGNYTQIRNWEFLGGRLFAQKIYSRSVTVDIVTQTEMTTLKIMHTPVP